MSEPLFAVAWASCSSAALDVFLESLDGPCLNEPLMTFEIISEITKIETIAIGKKIRELARLRRLYGAGRWRKLKGVAQVRLRSGRIRLAELHWYEAHGIGRKQIKRKRYLD